MASEPAILQPTSSNNNSSTTNALSLRISKLLATNQFDHPDFRAALLTLDSLTFQDSSSPHIPISHSNNDRDSLRSLKNGGLRRIVEQQIRNRSREFLNVFSDLNRDLVELQSHLDQMNECCDEIQENLKTANSATKYLLEHTDSLRKQGEAVAAKQTMVEAFLKKFTLTESEIQALTSQEIQVNWSVFEAMDHCEQIRTDCASLLTGDSPFLQAENAGLDIMQSTSKYLDKGYDKILKWTLFESRSGLIKPEEVQPEVSPLMKRAISRLKRRPESLDEVITALTSARSSSLSGLFLDALTRGGPSGLPRPIELIAHDPIRYVGDMLAWIHQVMASEHEFLESLLDIKSDGRRVGESRIFPTNPSGSTLEENPAGNNAQGTSELTVTDSGGAGDREMARKLLDKHLEGCIRPLKMRVQQTLNSQESSLTACQLASLLEFYQLTMSSTIGPDAKLTQALSELMDQSYEVFYQLLRSLASDYLKRLEPPPVDLSVPTPLHEAMSKLSVIMSIYEGSKEEGTSSSSQHSFERVLDLVVDPMLEVIDQMARLRAAEWDRSIFWLNCLEFMLTTLDSCSSNSTLEKLDGLRETHLEKLIAQYTAHLTSTSGLEPVLKAIETKDPDTPLSRIEEANSNAISEALQKFDKFLTNVDTILSSNKLLSLLNASGSSKSHGAGGDQKKKETDDGEGVPSLKEVVLKKTLNQLVDKYQIIHHHVLDPANRFQFKSTILIRSLDEVKTLIGFL